MDLDPDPAIFVIYLQKSNSSNQGFCLMIEGSGSWSVHLTNGAGFRRPNKNIRIRRIRIRNTAHKSLYPQVLYPGSTPWRRVRSPRCRRRSTTSTRTRPTPPACPPHPTHPAPDTGVRAAQTDPAGNIQIMLLPAVVFTRSESRLLAGPGCGSWKQIRIRNFIAKTKKILVKI